MDGESWIVVPRWDEFQHRDMARSTVPPWIKNHTKLLHDDAYRGLTGHQRAILHGLWLEYASARRQLTLSTLSLSRRLGLRVSMAHIEALSRAGFIEVSASRPAGRLAGKVAGLEVEVEKKEELRSSTNTAIAPVQIHSRYQQLMAAGHRYAHGWKGGSSEAFDTGLDELEDLYHARFEAGDRYRLWDVGLHQQAQLH